MIFNAIVTEHKIEDKWPFLFSIIEVGQQRKWGTCTWEKSVHYRGFSSVANVALIIFCWWPAGAWVGVDSCRQSKCLWIHRKAIDLKYLRLFTKVHRRSFENLTQTDFSSFPGGFHISRVNYLWISLLFPKYNWITSSRPLPWRRDIWMKFPEKLRRKISFESPAIRPMTIRGFGIIWRTEINYFTFVINKQRVMKTRNLKTDMTEFQWWWSHFPKYKKIVTWQSGNFFSSELKRKYFLNMKTFITASDALSISSTAVTFLSTSNIKSGAILNRNWNLFILIDGVYVIISVELHENVKTRKQNCFQRNRALIIFFLLMKQHCCAKGNVNELRLNVTSNECGKILKFVAYCLRLMDCFF